MGPMFNWLCSIAYVVSVVCYVVKIFDFICMLLDFIDDSVVGVVKRKIRDFVNHIRNIFYVSVEFKHSFHFETNQSVSLEEISAKMIDEIRQRSKKLTDALDFMSVACSFVFLIMIFKMLQYHYKFLKSDKFDNHFITDDFKDIDIQRAKHGQEQVLPLNRRERRQYIMVSSRRLVATEKIKLAKSAIFMGMTTLKLGIQIVADYCVYWVLVIIRRHGEVKTTVEAPNTAGVHVQGKGLLADLYRSVVKAFKPLGAKMEIDTQPCLPTPIPPDYPRNMGIVGVILLTWLFVVLEPYGLRWRNKFMCYYYPDRARQRAVWLYNHILRSRGTFLKFARRQLRRKFGKSKDGVIEKVSLMDRLHAKFPILNLILGKSKQKMCLVCGRVVRDSDEEQLVTCGTPKCPGQYCASCYGELLNMCTVCKKPIDYGDLSDLSIEKDSSEEGDQSPSPAVRNRKKPHSLRDMISNRRAKEDVELSLLAEDQPQERDRSSSELSYSYQNDVDSDVNATKPPLVTRPSFRDVEAQQVPDLASTQVFNASDSEGSDYQHSEKDEHSAQAIDEENGEFTSRGSKDKEKEYEVQWAFTKFTNPYMHKKLNDDIRSGEKKRLLDDDALDTYADTSDSSEEINTENVHAKQSSCVYDKKDISVFQQQSLEDDVLSGKITKLEVKSEQVDLAEFDECLRYLKDLSKTREDKTLRVHDPKTRYSTKIRQIFSSAAAVENALTPDYWHSQEEEKNSSTSETESSKEDGKRNSLTKILGRCFSFFMRLRNQVSSTSEKQINISKPYKKDDKISQLPLLGNDEMSSEMSSEELFSREKIEPQQTKIYTEEELRGTSQDINQEQGIQSSVLPRETFDKVSNAQDIHPKVLTEYVISKDLQEQKGITSNLSLKAGSIHSPYVRGKLKSDVIEAESISEGQGSERDTEKLGSSDSDTSSDESYDETDEYDETQVSSRISKREILLPCSFRRPNRECKSKLLKVSSLSDSINTNNGDDEDDEDDGDDDHDDHDDDNDDHDHDNTDDFKRQHLLYHTLQPHPFFPPPSANTSLNQRHIHGQLSAVSKKTSSDFLKSSQPPVPADHTSRGFTSKQSFSQNVEDMRKKLVISRSGNQNVAQVRYYHKLRETQTSFQRSADTSGHSRQEREVPAKYHLQRHDVQLQESARQLPVPGERPLYDFDTLPYQGHEAYFQLVSELEEELKRRRRRSDSQARTPDLLEPGVRSSTSQLGRQQTSSRRGTLNRYQDPQPSTSAYNDDVVVDTSMALTPDLVPRTQNANINTRTAQKNSGALHVDQKFGRCRFPRPERRQISQTERSASFQRTAQQIQRLPMFRRAGHRGSSTDQQTTRHHDQQNICSHDQVLRNANAQHENRNTLDVDRNGNSYPVDHITEEDEK